MTRDDDAENRRRSLTDLESSFLVEAAAGTGKTALMAGRVAMLLAKGVQPACIAAITFTELAAGELACRIRGYVAALLQGVVPDVLKVALPDGLAAEQRTNLSRASSRLDEMTASTIHGFCQEVIRSYAVEAELDPGARVMDAPTSDALFDAAFSDWLVGRLSAQTSDPDDPVAVITKSDPLQFEQALKDLADLKRRHPSARTVAPAVDERPDLEFAEAVRDFARWYAGAGVAQPATASALADLERLASFFEGKLSRTSTFEDLWRLSRPPRVNLMKKYTLDFRQYRCKSAWIAAAGKDRGTKLNENAEKFFERADAEYRKLLGHIANRVVAKVSDALDGVLTLYDRRKADAAVLDFDDLLKKALGLVSKHEAVRVALGARFTHLLVDEFQDTDPTQAGFIFLVCSLDRPARWYEARLRPGSLFLVGDPKQAIYRFRGADIGAYMRARKTIEADDNGEVLQIFRNFRSEKSIVDHINACFEPVLSKDGQPGYVKLAHTIELKESDLPCVAKMTVDVPPDTKPADQREAEAEAVAELCRLLVGAVNVKRSDGSVTRLRWNDIALLAPTGTDLWRYERALEQRRISIASQAGKALFLKQETQDVLALLRVIADPYDTVAFGALMRGPMVGLTENKLLDIAAGLPPAASGEPAFFTVRTPLEKIRDASAREIVKRLRHLRSRAAVTTPMVLLAEAVELLGIRVILSARDRSRRARSLANVDALIEMARPYGVAGLKEFVRDIQRKWEAKAPRDEGRTDSAEDAVELVTIHSSKGLEWPVVIPINTATQFRSPPQFLHRQSDDTLHWVLGGVTPVDLLPARAEEEHNEMRQRERMWYVVCSRARNVLILPNLPAAPQRSWARVVDVRHADLPEIDLSGLTQTERPRPSTLQNRQTAEVFAEEAARVTRSSSALRWERPSDYDLDRLPEGQVTATEFEPAAEIVAPAVGGRIRGVLLHKLMEELIGGELPDDEVVVAQRAGVLTEQLREADATAVEPREAAVIALRTLRMPQIASLRERLVPEVSLWSSADEATMIAGRADAVVAHGGRITTVIDWKSDVAPSAQERSAYVGQLSAYLSATGAERGALVYMSLGEIVWVDVMRP